MKDYDADFLTELGLDDFEENLFKLLLQFEKLKAENIALKAKQAALLEERSDLVDKNELARKKVESILVRLKEMEAEA